MVIMLPYSAKPSSTANPLFLLCVSNIGALCKDNRQGKTSILWTYVLYCIVVSCYIVLLLHGPPNSGIPWETKPNYYYDMWNWIWDAQLLMWHNISCDNMWSSCISIFDQWMWKKILKLCVHLKGENEFLKWYDVHLRADVLFRLVNNNNQTKWTGISWMITFPLIQCRFCVICE